MSTMPSHHHERRTTPVEAVTGILWFWTLSGLALTIALVVVGGPGFIASPTVQIVLAAMLVTAVVHAVHQRRHAAELHDDPRLRRARERRGF